jgi:hypothetical protein
LKLATVISTDTYRLATIIQNETGLWLQFVHPPKPKQVSFAAHDEIIPNNFRTAPDSRRVTFADFDEVRTYNEQEPYYAFVREYKDGKQITFHDHVPVRFPPTPPNTPGASTSVESTSSSSQSSSSGRQTRSGREF